MKHLELKTSHPMGCDVEGIALVASDGLSARYDLDRNNGTFSRKSHKLYGQSYVNRILVLDAAKGGVASAWMLNEMKSRGVIPLAIILNSVNPIIAQGAALAGLTLLGGFDSDVTKLVPYGALVTIDATAGLLRVAVD